MLRTSLFSSGFSLVALSAAAPALAQVSAPDLWAEWQAQSQITQQEITAASETYADGVLTLEGLVTRTDQDGVLTLARLERLTIAEQSDGTAIITAASPYNVRVETETPFDATQTFDMDAAHEGLEIRVAGEPGDRLYSYEADQLVVTGNEFTDEFGEPVDVDVTFTMAGMEATYSVRGTAEADDLSFVSAGNAERMSAVVAGVDGPSTFSFNMALSDLAASSDGNLSGLMALGTAEAVPTGMTMTGGIEYGALELAFGFEEPTETLAFESRNEGGALEVGLLDTVLRYALRGTAPVVSLESSQMPMPINVSADSTEVDLSIPMRPGDTPDAPQEADILVDYTNLTIGEEVWSTFDAGGAIPRSPANLLLDLSAQVVVLQDLLGSEPAGFGPPFDPRAVTLDALRLAFGGAELTGSGAVTLPGGMMDPTPVGSVDLRMTGGNALIQSMGAAGLLPEEQAMMTMMMIGMVAVPGDTPDSLVSNIEFLADGTILANGAPLPF